jgi:hypothetical protein
MKEITHLVVNGCSWTYCQGLDDPTTQGWPALVAKELGLDVVNLAVPGSGNDGIHRRTYEYVLKNLPTGSRPFFVIAWSQSWRQEAWYETFLGNKYQYYHTVAKPPNTKNLDEYQLPLIMHWNDEHHFRRTMLYKSSLKSLFLSQDIPYIMSDYAGDHAENVAHEKYKDLIKDELDFIYDKNHVVPFWEVTFGLPLTKCGHDGPQSQVVLKDYIINKIKELYNITPVPSKEYLPINSIKMEYHSCWKK